MAMSQFPPQAYTRDVLATAYEWLRGQPISVREMAQDSDSLVALYMQYRRRADAQMIQSSSESFKQDLKNLAEGLKQFEDPNAPKPPTNQASPSMLAQLQMEAQIQQTQAKWHAQQIQQQVSQSFDTATAQPMQPPHPPLSQYQTQPLPTQPLPPTQQAPQPMQQPQYVMQQRTSTSHRARENSNHFTELDEKTRQKIQFVQERMNLSHENEAMRMLITLGFEQIEKLLPKI